MKVAVAGLGGAALRAHLPALRQMAATGQVEVIGACDPNPARRAEAAALHPDVPLFPDARSLFDATQPDLLAVTTDPTAHVEVTRLALQRGCDVVCEKPVAVSQSGYDVLAEVWTEQPERALVPVHQYRYSPAWTRITNWARSLTREPFQLTVRVERPGTDPHAATPWRTDPRAGGGLADHGVHYLALARDLHSYMTAQSATRSYDHLEREHVRGIVAVGPGILALGVNYGANQRRTTVTLHAGGRWMRWCDGELQWRTADDTVTRQNVPALSDRRHVDGLYLHLYQEVLARRSHPGWREERWQEILDVGRVLVGLGRAIDAQPARTGAA